MKKNLKMNRLTPHTVALRLAPVAAALILSGAATSALAQDHDAHGAHDAAAQSSAAPAAERRACGGGNDWHGSWGNADARGQRASRG